MDNYEEKCCKMSLLSKCVVPKIKISLFHRFSSILYFYIVGLLVSLEYHTKLLHVILTSFIIISIYRNNSKLYNGWFNCFKFVLNFYELRGAHKNLKNAS